ncbi:hypothetical protein BO78DRAFT_428298 [Aspergillus sclerotiicarbonarius CBS 121057]|uniref:F-box domain-containing protein n=1 Tax=Aspergillus sclerotiicarbonarius (strain CBS 121057 / IBT 28362) TaxID=1448318 RepID=A0A319EZY1_ASPSB|nr:hypothetical protein BO78DRAFT_428298 [Aspergillus sclerotiicarbonarius CBS 121057]
MSTKSTPNMTRTSSLSGILRRHINTLTSLLSPKSTQPTPSPAIFNLPEHLIRNIFNLLPPIDQIRLSLTCKLYLATFPSPLKHPDFHFPHLLQIMNPDICTNNPSLPRNQLLIHLETPRWKFCTACLKLHPRRSFPRSSLSLPPLERRCMAYAGIADLCPCISLTFHNPTLVHEFCVADNAVVKATLQMTLSINANANTNDSTLLLQSRYKIHVHPPRLPLIRAPIFVCAHTDLLLLSGAGEDSTDCCVCATHIEVSAAESRRNHVVVDVT